MKLDPNKKQHWFLMAFMYPSPGMWMPHSFYTSSPSKIMTVPRITQAKESNNVPEGAVLIGFSYAGYETAHGIRGTSDAPVPTKMSQAYRNGMQAALTVDRSVEVNNPYVMAEGDPNQGVNVMEFAEGFAEGRNMQEVAERMRESNAKAVPVEPTT